jgi:hypothetical protein
MDVDESLGGSNASRLVAGSSFSCYIPAGWGMMPTGVLKPDNTMEFAAAECEINTYGVANTTFGLQATPCKVGGIFANGCQQAAQLTLGVQQPCTFCAAEFHPTSKGATWIVTQLAQNSWCLAL